MNSPKPPNRRTDNRLDICLKVDVTYEDGSSAVFCTRNMSTTGLFLDKGENELPEIGSILHVQVCSGQGITDAPRVKAEVARKTAEGIGVIFLSP